MLIDVARGLNRRLPAGLRRALLVRRRAGYWLEAGVVFIHVPKAAGTSFNEALYGRFIGHPRALDIERWAAPAVRALPRFGVTRNPWDRLVSAWRFARRGAGEGETYRAGMWRPERYRVPEFDSFDRFVKEWLARRDVSRLDGVFQPQSMFLCGPDLVPLVDQVGRFEDLGPTLDFVERHTGRRPAIARANRSGEGVDHRQFYTPELVRIVGEIYRSDIEAFGHDF